MRPLTGFRRPVLTDGQRRDPAPTRWSYRYQRMMLTPLIRAAVRVGLPAFAVTFAAGLWFTSDANRTAITARFTELRDSIQNRPEFLVGSLQITGAEAALTQAIADMVQVGFPVSSFALDLPALRDQILALSAVRDATVGIRSGGVLDIVVTERRPVAVWRYADGLRLIDAEGQMTGMIATRSDRADLPLIAGDGAKEVIAEAMELFAVAGPLAPRLRGLVRMGERRWDVVLDRDQRILLPDLGAVAALERVVALDQAQDMLARDIAVVDMRAIGRPTIRLNRAAINVLRNVTETVAETTE